MSARTLADLVGDVGFGLVPAAIGATRVAELVDALVDLLDEDRDIGLRDPIDAHMVQNLMLRDRSFLDLLSEPAVTKAFDDILGPTSIVYAYTSSTLPAAGTNHSNRIHVDAPRVIPDYPTNIGLIIALTDFTDANGATRFLPGSFERQDVPTSAEFERDSEVVYPRAGDMIVFNARTWHSGGVNTTGGPRHAVTINGCRSYMRQRFDYPRMVEPRLAATLPESTRRLLGFHVQVPTSLEEYYEPEPQRGYRTGQG